jgi:hypothetical protein
MAQILFLALQPLTAVALPVTGTDLILLARRVVLVAVVAWEQVTVKLVLLVLLTRLPLLAMLHTVTLAAWDGVEQAQMFTKGVAVAVLVLSVAAQHRINQTLLEVAETVLLLASVGLP